MRRWISCDRPSTRLRLRARRLPVEAGSISYSAVSHPLFRGDCVVWENIVVRKLPWYVRFSAGSNVTVAQNADGFSTEVKVPGVNVDRAIILGGQALAHAYGRITNLKHGGKSGHHFHLFDEPVNKGTRLEVSLQYMDGYRKFRWEDASGRVYDFGCAVMDTATS